jgi:DNA-binding response OmpR family regulator
MKGTILKLLAIEDDPYILSLLTRGLREEHHIVDHATDGLDGEYLASVNNYDAIILDWMLPSKNGIEILQSLRADQIGTPVLMLSAKGETGDKISGLRMGADDYLSKPFSFEELLARIESLHRRNISQGSNNIEIAELHIDLNNKNVSMQNKYIELTAKEYELLMLLIKHKNSIVSKAMIEEHLWGNEEFTNSNVVQVTIYHLRQKIGKGVIKSYRNLGYMIEDQ